MENLCSATCGCIKKVIIESSGKIIIIPHYNLLSKPDYITSPLEGCFCPRTSGELAKCLTGCLDNVLKENHKPVSEITTAVILDENGKEIKIR